MVKTYAQKLTPPYSGQVQIVETDTYRALTLDGQVWEVQYVNRIHIRVCTITAQELKTRSSTMGQTESDTADPKLGLLFNYLAEVELPFIANDHFEFWLLDNEDKSPLALIYSCATASQMDKFPNRAEWASLPDAVMKIEKTEHEIKMNAPPVNYQLESLVSERAGTNKKASWFDRREKHNDKFPSFLVREDWPESAQQVICKRYIDRQAPRLLMLQGLSVSHRERLESCCTPYATEVARFHAVYPEVLDIESMSALRVEARLRAATNC